MIFSKFFIKNQQRYINFLIDCIFDVLQDKITFKNSNPVLPFKDYKRIKILYIKEQLKVEINNYCKEVLKEKK